MSKNLRQIPITCSGHTRPVVDLRFSDITPYSYFIISACKDGLPMLREGDTGDWVGTFVGHKGAVWGATINKEATRAATGAADFTAKLWDAKSGVEIHSFSHRHIVKSVDFSSDTNHLVTGCNDKNLRLFDLENYATDPKVFSGHNSNIKKCILAEGSKKIISISDDKTLRVWDTVSNNQITQLNFDDIPTSIEQSRDGKMLILSHGKSVELYDLEKLEKVKFFSIPSVISAVSISPDKSLFVCGSENFTLYKYSIETGAEIESFKGHFGPVHCIQFSPDGEVYASGSEDGTLRLWQNTIGKTYGLWKLIDSEETNNINAVS
ncbi:Serine-threonine kinase receptor-associated [Brachionus plicatilis]|uniref:Serine-threonine kinase receptor-associated protein n=1 Tax=Brachionus plicatilis TaxID=10195 RepID=A0A3M7R6A0_BRAPC|nr:Serine-threonine kinase receptor-associated [Brachionus plicatilis]